MTHELQHTSDINDKKGILMQPNVTQGCLFQGQQSAWGVVTSHNSSPVTSGGGGLAQGLGI